jgi:hypothetical protein
MVIEASKAKSYYRGRCERRGRKGLPTAGSRSSARMKLFQAARTGRGNIQDSSTYLGAATLILVENDTRSSGGLDRSCRL